MNSEFLATPLTRGQFSKSIELGSGVKIRPISPILWDQSAIAPQFMSVEERKELSNARFWLTVDESDAPPISRSGDRYSGTKRALSAIQIINPVGARNVHIGFRNTPDGFDLLHTNHPQEMKPTYLGRLQRFDEVGIETDFDKIYAGICRADQEGIVRLQNPIVLLELGMQADHPYISTLLWTMGLDMLFMAGAVDPFCRRVRAFLGDSTPVFPFIGHLENFSQRPSTVVSQVVKDLYLLRNVIAHGQAIPESYRADFDIGNGNIDLLPFSLPYSQVLLEAALFILVSSLRKILRNDLVDEVKDPKVWRRSLDS